MKSNSTWSLTEAKAYQESIFVHDDFFFSSNVNTYEVYTYELIVLISVDRPDNPEKPYFSISLMQAQERTLTTWT